MLILYPGFASCNVSGIRVDKATQSLTNIYFVFIFRCIFKMQLFLLSFYITKQSGKNFTSICKRKRELPQFIPDDIPITLKNKVDDGIMPFIQLLEGTLRRIRLQKRCHTRIRNEQNAP